MHTPAAGGTYRVEVFATDRAQNVTSRAATFSVYGELPTGPVTPPADPPADDPPADDPPVDDPPVQEPPVSDPPADVPTDPPALELVAEALALLGRAEDAVAAFGELIDARPAYRPPGDAPAEVLAAFEAAREARVESSLPDTLGPGPLPPTPRPTPAPHWW